MEKDLEMDLFNDHKHNALPECQLLMQVKQFFGLFWKQMITLTDLVAAK